jgi:Uma2 family endonuclease
MSTVTPTDPVTSPMDPLTSPADPVWIPSPLYRLTLEQYDAMVDSGVFNAHDHVHLINGYLVAKMTQNDAHCTADDLCGEALGRVIPRGWYVRAAKPIRITSQQSKPEPDRCVVRGSIRDYSRRSPEATDVALVVEISDTSLSEDRKQAAIYAGSGIPVYWIVNLVDRQVEVYTGPGPAGYANRQDFLSGQQVPVVISGQQLPPVAVADILP